MVLTWSTGKFVKLYDFQTFLKGYIPMGESETQSKGL